MSATNTANRYGISLPKVIDWLFPLSGTCGCFHIFGAKNRQQKKMLITKKLGQGQLQNVSGVALRYYTELEKIAHSAIRQHNIPSSQSNLYCADCSKGSICMFC